MARLYIYRLSAERAGVCARREREREENAAYTAQHTNAPDCDPDRLIWSASDNAQSHILAPDGAMINTRARAFA